MADSDYEYEYEYSDNDDEEISYAASDDNDSDNDTMSCTKTSSFTPDENANPNAPPSPARSRIRKSPSSQLREQTHSPNRRARHQHNDASKTISPNDLQPMIQRRIHDVTEALGIPTEAAAPLLRRYKWNTQRVLEAFMSDSERALSQAGVTHRCGAGAGGAGSPLVLLECSICMEELEESSNSMSMPCGHTFCLDCWQDYLTNAIQYEGATCTKATCPDAGCAEVLTEVEIRRAAPNLLPKYQHYQLRSVAEAVGRWCPGAGCDRVHIFSFASNTGVADCDACGSCFCTGCGEEEPHAPCPCPNLAKWKEKGADESETVNWLTVNTKNCPKCSSRIEKNGGCMYIRCQNCRHSFCWVCMGTHHVWQCNAYKEPEDGKLKAKNELERYLHYFNRYKGHDDAQNFARKQLDKKRHTFAAPSKQQEKQSTKDDKDNNGEKSNTNSSSSSNNNNKKEPDQKAVANAAAAADSMEVADLPDFLKDANQQLVTCRRVLKYTYVFAYYHFVDPKRKVAKECFEFHQGTLEGLTEGLSKATEMALEDIDQQDVVNRTRAIGEFIKNVLAHVDNGMDDEY